MKESDIRPQEVFDKYLLLSQKDGQGLDHEKFVNIECPVCPNRESKVHLKKNGFTYKQCLSCHTVFCSPRPSPEQLDYLYKESESSHFWSNVFFPAVANVRKEKIFQPKAKSISELLKDKRFNPETICDVGAGHGLLLDSLKEYFPQSTYFAVEPDSTSSKICTEKGYIAIQDAVENIKLSHEGFDLVVSFEVIEHVFDLKRFLQSLYNITRSGGYMLITGLCYEGFDILSLQENSKSISPPHHLNFVSLEGVSESLKNIGFNEVKVWTPGKLDVDIVLNANTNSEFLRVLRNRGLAAVEDFQHFLVKHNMSSHMWILAKK